MKVIKTSTLYKMGCRVSNNTYSGHISGNEVTFLCANAYYLFTIKEGIKGTDIPVMVTIDGDEYSIEYI